MGEEIQYSRFNKSHYDQFEKHLREETNLLSEWFEDNAFSTRELTAGYELETWLVDDRCTPVALNEHFLEIANNKLLTPELARFNVELNVEPQADAEDDAPVLWPTFDTMAEALKAGWEVSYWL